MKRRLDEAVAKAVLKRIARRRLLVLGYSDIDVKFCVDDLGYCLMCEITYDDEKGYDTPFLQTSHISNGCFISKMCISKPSYVDALRHITNKCKPKRRSTTSFGILGANDIFTSDTTFEQALIEIDLEKELN